MSFFPNPAVAPVEPANKSFTDAELRLNLSIFGFSRLSATDQREQTEEFCTKVVENVTVVQLSAESEEDFRLRKFSELFKKLPFSEQSEFLSRVIKIFKRKRLIGELISWFQKQDASVQERMIGEITDHVPAENLQIPGETEEDFRLRKFVELFKKIPFAEQVDGLSRVKKMFKRERQIGELISGFQKQDASVQERMIGEITDHVPAENHQIPGETEEDFRLRKFVELIKKIPFAEQDYSSMVVIWSTPELQMEDLISWFKKLDASVQERSEKVREGDDEGFDEFFLGFSTIWFKGQSAEGQAKLIVQLCDGVSKLPDESEDFRLTTFTELCKKADFAKQAKLLSIADCRLRGLILLYPHGRLLQPQDPAGAAELLSRLSAFGFSLLSAADQQEKIEKLSHEVKGVAIERLAEEIGDEEDFRRKTFTELFNKATVSTRYLLFKELKKKFFRERELCESILWFRQLGSNYQQELLDKIFDQMRADVKDIIVEKLIEESEEDFRLRRFIKLWNTQHQYGPIPWSDFVQPEAEMLDPKGTFDDEEEIKEIKQSRYAEFYFGLSIIWFKTRCSNHPRNPIEIILGEREIEGHIIEKLPNESEEDFKLRRFTELFEKLTVSSQERIVGYIQDTIFHDLGHRKPTKCYAQSASFHPRKRSWVPEFRIVKYPKLNGGGGAATTTQSTQGGQGTSQR